MKQIRIVPFMLVLNLFAFSSIAIPKLPPHMSGFGIFTFKSTVPMAADKEKAIAYAKDVKAKGFSYVMIKSHDGNSWGTRVGKEWEPCISKDLIDAFHSEGMRVYSYFTARTVKDESITGSIEHAITTLDMGADGVIVDDLGLFGVKPAQWEKLFKPLRTAVDQHKDKILAASTFPHMMNLRDPLWGIVFQYSDYFLPQEYWMQFFAYDKDGKKVTMAPQNALAYGQAQFDAVLARRPDSKCKLIPIGRTYGDHVTAEHINKFIEAAKPYYAGAGLFVIEQEPPKGGWKAIVSAVKTFVPEHSIQDISLIAAFNQLPKPKVVGQKIEKEEKEKKPAGAKKKSLGSNWHTFPGTPN